MTLTIRPAEPDDFEAVGEITVRAYLDGGHLAEDSSYVQTLADARGRAEGAELWVAADDDGKVLVNELIIGVRILLETVELASCPAMDGDSNGAVAVNELVAGVRSALAGCGDAVIATELPL